MEVLHLDHFTLRVSPERVPALKDFYARVLGLREGPRPDFPFPGAWMYAGESAVIHLAGNEPAGEPPVLPALPTGKFNHVSLRTRGLESSRAHLRAQGVAWTEAPVPGAPLHQIFLTDPVGLQIELTFDSAELSQAPSTAITEGR